MRHLAVLLASLLLLTSCSVFRMKADKSEAAWNARRALLEKIDRFSLEARVSSGLAMRGNLTWAQQPDAFDMRVAGPFGVGAANITGRGRQIQIKTSKGTFTTDDPENDLKRRLGWSFPVSHLRWWVLGVPAPGTAPEVDFDRDGLLTTLAQDDWTVEYEEYQEAGAFELPRKFVVANDEVKIKVVVDSWNVR